MMDNSELKHAIYSSMNFPEVYFYHPVYFRFGSILGFSYLFFMTINCALFLYLSTIFNFQYMDFNMTPVLWKRNQSTKPVRD